MNSARSQYTFPHSSLFVLLLLATSAASFSIPPTFAKMSSLHDKADSTALADARAGTFFNKVPSDDNDDDGGGNQGADVDDGSAAAEFVDFDESVASLLRRRKAPSRASEPSTINGVPTAKSKGFGKQIPSVQKLQDGNKDFIGIGKPSFNDITNPEYDDQGYTLYANEQTGEKSRVFEALVDYPCEFTLKIVGANEGLFVQDMVAVVAESCQVEVDDIRHSVRAVGKWTSVTVQAPVQSAEMLYALYENVDQDPRVRFKF